MSSCKTYTIVVALRLELSPSHVRPHAPTIYNPPRQAALIEGVESLSQARVGSALQVIFNLNELQHVGALAPMQR